MIAYLRPGLRSNAMFQGSIPALVTPFRDGRFDEAAFTSFVDWQIREGSSALVPCGPTGESATRTIEENKHDVAICIKEDAGRVTVIAGGGLKYTVLSCIYRKT